MNYLAHFYLSSENEDAIVGSWLGDHIKGQIPQSLPMKVRAAVQLHRCIDSFTDQHPLLAVKHSPFCKPLKRYHGIILDVFFDHCLAVNWNRFHQQSLQDFSQQIYQALQQNQPLFKPDLQHYTARMINQDWLTSYSQRAVLERALFGISQRLRRKNPLAQAYQELCQQAVPLQELFFEFMPQLDAYVREYKNSLNKFDQGNQPRTPG